MASSGILIFPRFVGILDPIFGVASSTLQIFTKVSGHF